MARGGKDCRDRRIELIAKAGSLPLEMIAQARAMVIGRVVQSRRFTDQGKVTLNDLFDAFPVKPPPCACNRRSRRCWWTTA
jgi:hypothetical protein